MTTHHAGQASRQRRREEAVHRGDGFRHVPLRTHWERPGGENVGVGGGGGGRPAVRGGNGPAARRQETRTPRYRATRDGGNPASLALQNDRAPTRPSTLGSPAR